MPEAFGILDPLLEEHRMLLDGKLFVYRHNIDSSIDSICTKCFKTICSVYTMDDVNVAELAHECLGPATFDAVIKNKRETRECLPKKHGSEVN